MTQDAMPAATQDWIEFPGGELEGLRPRVLCPECRAKVQAAARGKGSRRRLAAQRSRTLCFACYRAGLDRDRALREAGSLDTGSAERFQEQLPFEPVNRPRLDALKADREAARTIATQGTGRFVDKRRHAQIAARHALQRIASGLAARRVGSDPAADHSRREYAWATAVHAAELQLPDAWLPFVVSR